MADRYRPPDRRPPDRSQPSLGGYATAPPRLPPPPMMRRFGQANGGDHYAPAQNNFSFRPQQQHTPQYPDASRGFQHSHRPPPRGPRRQPPRHGNNRRPPRDRPFRPKVATAERPLLQFERGSTPEQLEGMSADRPAATYRNVDELSDSEEQSMDESVEEENGNAQLVAGSKRLKTANSASETAAQAPQWSNAELYTSLPPIDDASERKRRDVVKLIRKARVEATRENSTTKPLEGDDYISFGFEDEEKEAEEEAEEDANSSRPYSHLPAAPVTVHLGGLIVEPSQVQVASIPSEMSVASRLQSGTKRKRDDADTGGPLLPPRQKTGRGGKLDGIVTNEWSERAGLNPTPWIEIDHRRTENCGFRLHKEVCDFFEFVKPRPHEQLLRQQFVDRLARFIGEMSHGSCTVHAFGSYAAGLYLPNSDMDMVAVSASYMSTGRKVFTQTKKEMYRLARALSYRGLAVDSSIEVIAGAKVPIIKFVDPETRLNIDLSFENTTGLTANETFQRWKVQYPAIPALVTLIKQFLMMRGLNNVANGGIGGFSVTCLVVALLQNLPRVQMGLVRPELHLGEMLIELLDFYGNQLDYARTAIRMEPPGLIEKVAVPFIDLKNPNKVGRLCIIDPNTPTNDISGGTKEIDLIFLRFAQARVDLLKAMQNAESNESLLRCLIGGNYNDLLWHRWHFDQLRQAQHGNTRHNAISIG